MNLARLAIAGPSNEIPVGLSADATACQIPLSFIDPSIFVLVILVQPLPVRSIQIFFKLRQLAEFLFSKGTDFVAIFFTFD
jgi:hypothetical protein